MTESMNLVVAAQAGDELALNDLLDRYQARIRRIVRIRLGARLRQNIESMDIVQDTYKVAFQKISDLELRSQGSIIKWLSKIAENKIKDANDYFTAQKRDKRRETPLEARSPSDSSSGFERDLAADQASPQEQAFEQEMKAILDDAMTGLKDEHREIILARDYCGESWEEVAQSSGYGENLHAAQELHRRAWIKLRTLVAPKLRDDSE